VHEENQIVVASVHRMGGSGTNESSDKDKCHDRTVAGGGEEIPKNVLKGGPNLDYSNENCIGKARLLGKLSGGKTLDERGRRPIEGEE